MKDIFLLLICLLVAYFFGTILFAIPITKIFIGKDIRKIGNTNPGTSNVFKNVGPLAGTIVALLDMAKGVIPIAISKALFFPDDTTRHWIFLFLIGFAAILGHTRPYWNHFKKGGGGMGTAVGMYIYFVPIEFGISILIGIFITYVFMKDAQYKFGRWVMMYAAAVVPFIVFALNRVISIKLLAHISLGNHNLGVVLGTFFLLGLLLLLNTYELILWLKNPNSHLNPRRDGDV